MSESIEKKIEAILRRIKPEAEYREEFNLSDDLGLDSLDTIEFIFEVETQLMVKIPEEEIDEKGLLVLGNMCKYVKGRLSFPN